MNTCNHVSIVYDDGMARPSITQQVKRAIRDSGMTRYEISQRSGVAEAVLSRFMNGETSMNLATLDRLASVLRLRITVERKALRSTSINTRRKER